MTAIRVVVVGTSFGGRVHVPALRAAGFDVVALVGQDEERTSRRAEELGVPLGTTDLEQALAQLDTGPKAVTVSTSPDAHVAPVLAALECGAHVICEKPFARSASEATQLVTAAQKAGVVALIGAEFRWAPSDALMARIVHEGQLGDPRLVTIVQHNSLLAGEFPETFNGDWWLDPHRGGGLLNAAAFHYIDRFLTWLGPIASVTASVQAVDMNRDGNVEDTYTVVTHFASGATGLLQACSVDPGRPTRLCRVVGTRGSAWIDDDGLWVADGGGTRLVPVPSDLEVGPALTRSTDPMHLFTHMELPPYIRLTERFRDLILGQAPPAEGPRSPTFADAFAVQEVTDAIRQSMMTAGSLIELSL